MLAFSGGASSACVRPPPSPAIDPACDGDRRPPERGRAIRGFLEAGIGSIRSSCDEQ
jgi:hypothetical protein